MSEEIKRAERISVMTDSLHLDSASLYERIVDREYGPAKEKAKAMIADLRSIIKLIEDEDF